MEGNHSNASYTVTSSSTGSWANSSLNLRAGLQAGLRLSCEVENVHGAQSASVLLLPGQGPAGGGGGGRKEGIKGRMELGRAAEPGTEWLLGPDPQSCSEQNSRFCKEVGRQDSERMSGWVHIPLLCREVGICFQSGSCSSWRRWCHGPTLPMLVSHLLLHVSLCPGEVQGAETWEYRERPQSPRKADLSPYRVVIWQVRQGNSFIERKFLHV